MARDDLHFRLRIPEDLKLRVEEAASANRRSMTAEIVDRLDKSFGHDEVLEQLRAEIAVAEGFSASDTGMVQFRVPRAVVDLLEIRAKARSTTIGGEIRDIVREALDPSSSPANELAEQKRLRQQIDRQREQIERVRNDRFGGRAVTAQMDLMRDQLKAAQERVIELERQIAVQGKTGTDQQGTAVPLPDDLAAIIERSALREDRTIEQQALHTLRLSYQGASRTAATKD